MAQGIARIGKDRYRTEIEVGGRSLVADEPPALGGQRHGGLSAVAVRGNKSADSFDQASVMERTTSGHLVWLKQPAAISACWKPP